MYKACIPIKLMNYIPSNNASSPIPITLKKNNNKIMTLMALDSK